MRAKIKLPRAILASLLIAAGMLGVQVGSAAAASTTKYFATGSSVWECVNVESIGNVCGWVDYRFAVQITKVPGNKNGVAGNTFNVTGVAGELRSYTYSWDNLMFNPQVGGVTIKNSAGTSVRYTAFNSSTECGLFASSTWTWGAWTRAGCVSNVGYSVWVPLFSGNPGTFSVLFGVPPNPLIASSSSVYCSVPYSPIIF